MSYETSGEMDRAAILQQMIAAKYPGKGVLKIAEAGEVAGVKRSRAYTLVAEGVIPSVTIGSRRVVPVDLLISWLIELGEETNE